MALTVRQDDTVVCDDCLEWDELDTLPPHRQPYSTTTVGFCETCGRGVAQRCIVIGFSLAEAHNWLHCQGFPPGAAVVVAANGRSNVLLGMTMPADKVVVLPHAEDGECFENVMMNVKMVTDRHSLWA